MSNIGRQQHVPKDAISPKHDDLQLHLPVIRLCNACGLLMQAKVTSVTSAQDGQAQKYAYSSTLTTDGYDVS